MTVVSRTDERQKRRLADLFKGRPFHVRRAVEGADAKFVVMWALTCPHNTAIVPDMSAFALEDGGVYRTYSTFARGLDSLWGMYQWLDRAPKGRNEIAPWWRRHDEYDKA